MPAGHSAPDSRRAPPTREPFEAYLDVPVAGGALTVARAGARPEPGRPVALLVHGMTSGHPNYRGVARELCSITDGICVLAPDLRGRGRSAHLPAPYGMATHIADLLAVLDHVGADRAVVVGHSMGCHIAARFAVDHPERAAAVLLLDSGLPVVSEGPDSDDHEEGEVRGLLYRLETTFATVEDYLEYWRAHPALDGAWDEDVEALVGSDYVEDEDGVHCVVNLEAVIADLADLTFDGVTMDAVTRVHAPVRLLRAERGLVDDDPLIPLRELQEFVRRHPHVSVETVPDVNHYTIVLGSGHGPLSVAATLAELVLGRPPS
jgi:lipase